MMQFTLSDTQVPFYIALSFLGVCVCATFAPAAEASFVGPPQSEPMLDLLFASESNRNHRRRSANSLLSDNISYGGYDVPSVLPGTSTGSLAADNYYVPVSRHTTHSIEPKDVEISSSEEFNPEPQTVIVDATVMPLTIYFRSISSIVKVVQEHLESKGQVQHSTSEDEPTHLIHEVRKPIIQEIHEIIKPYRRIITEMSPVQEEIKTIISRRVEGDQLRETLNEPPNYRPMNRFEGFGGASDSYLANRFNLMDNQSNKGSVSDHQEESARLLPPKAQTTDYGKGSKEEQDGDSAYERHSPPNSGDQIAEVTSTSTTEGTPTSTTTSTSTTTTPPLTTKASVVARKKRKHRIVEKSLSKSLLVPGETRPLTRRLTRTQRLSIKRLVNKIDRQKGKIRLGFFGLYGINVIPYIFDQFALNVKVQMPKSTQH